MSTHSSSSFFAHTSDATFQQWGSELHAALIAAGWEQTADTGQIDWELPPARPAANASAGYEVYRLNDSLRDESPIFIKLEYGTHHGGANTPDMWLTIGNGSNGAGTITPIIYARTSIGPTSSRPINSTSTNYLTFACATEGAAWFVHKNGARQASNGRGFFAVAILRTVDDDGAITGDGIVVYRDSGDANGAYSALATSINLATGWSATRPNGAGYGFGYTFNPYGMSSVLYGGSPPSIQVNRHFCVLPEARPLEHILSTPETALVPAGTTFDAAVLGAERTFMCVGNAFSAYDFICLPWE